MRGMTWKSLKETYSLVPLFGIMGVAMTAASLYLTRLATKKPDVSWRPRSNTEPFNDMVDANGNTKGSKLYHSVQDVRQKYGVKAFPDERPPIEKMWADYRKKH